MVCSIPDTLVVYLLIPRVGCTIPPPPSGKEDEWETSHPPFREQGAISYPKSELAPHACPPPPRFKGVGGPETSQALQPRRILLQGV